MTHLQEWYEARKQCLEAPINDPYYRTKLNRLSEAEDALYKYARDENINNLFEKVLDSTTRELNQ